MEKTEKSVSEINIEFNNTYEWDSLTAGNKELVTAVGAGFQGIKNLGNTCYMNSFIQVRIPLAYVHRIQRTYLFLCFLLLLLHQNTHTHTHRTMP